MEYTRINKDKLLELLYEAYQAGCFGYMELKETQCEKVAAGVHWETTPTMVVPPTVTIPSLYSYDGTPGADHLPPQQHQTSFMSQADFENMRQQMAQQEHIAKMIREQSEDYQVFSIGDVNTNVEVKSMQEQNPR
jgi:hypothetical protein